MKSLLLSISFVSICAFSLNAQIDINGGPTNIPVEGVVDGVVIKEIIPTKRMIPYEFVREADMMWSKRIHRYIDKREKLNLPLFFPNDDIFEGPEGPNGPEEWVKNTSRYSLWTVIRENILKGNLTIYMPYNPNQFRLRDGDQLKYPLEVKRNVSIPFYDDAPFKERVFQGFLGFEDRINSTREVIIDPNDPYGETPLYDTLGIDEEGYPILEERMTPYDMVSYTSRDIVRYNIKEDWFFDKERSVLDQRIIAIAPVVFNQENKTYEELFWLYFPECRFVFNNYYVYNTKNDSQWMSFDDFFWKRQFTSTIYQQSDVFDRKIEDYRYGIDALLESQKITEDIRTFENDLWHF